MPGTVNPEVESRLVELAATVAAASEGVAAVDARSSARVEAVATRTAAVEQLVMAAGERLEVVERDRDVVAETLSRGHRRVGRGAGGGTRPARCACSAQASADKVQETVGSLLDDARARLDTLDGAHAAVAAEIVRVSATLRPSAQRCSIGLRRLPHAG